MNLTILTKANMIRKIKEKDIRRVIRLEKEIFNESFGKEFIFSSLIGLNSARYLVFTYFGKIIGYVGYIQTEFEVEIFGIGIIERLQNRGYGTRLMKNLIKRLKKQNVKKAFLDVRTKNNKAIHVYEKMGFKKIKRRPKFYDNDDSYTLAKDIS